MLEKENSSKKLIGEILLISD